MENLIDGKVLYGWVEILRDGMTERWKDGKTDEEI